MFLFILNKYLNMYKKEFFDFLAIIVLCYTAVKYTFFLAESQLWIDWKDAESWSFLLIFYIDLRNM